MKKGKTIKLTGFRTSKVHFGTVDSKEFKSLYLNIQTWVEPKQDTENWSRVVLNLNRAVKHSVYEHIDKTMFDDKFIVDLDLRTSGLQLKKKSFMFSIQEDSELDSKIHCHNITLFNAETFIPIGEDDYGSIFDFNTSIRPSEFNNSYAIHTWSSLSHSIPVTFNSNQLYSTAAKLHCPITVAKAFELDG